VHHAGYPDVGAEVLLRVDLRSDVCARHRLAHNDVILRVLRLRFAGGVERVPDLLVPIELHVEIASPDELGVGRLFCCVGFGMHHTLGDGERIGGKTQLLGRHLDQHAARFGRRHAHLLPAALDTRGSRGAALVHAGGGVAHDHGDGLERHVELFRHHLADGDEQALAHIHLAEESGNAAVGINGDVRGELVGRERRLRALCKCIANAEHGIVSDRHADRDHQRATGLEQRAAREMRGLFHLGHCHLPQPIISAARLTARRMPICVPQRHLRPVSASLISASDGFFF
jgi:hypothetical protein